MEVGIPRNLSQETLGNALFTDLRTISIIMQNIVKTDGIVGEHITTHGKVWLDAAGRTYAQQIETAVLLPGLMGVKIYVGQAIKLRNSDIYIVSAYARGKHRKAFSIENPGKGMEFPCLLFKFNMLAEFPEHIDTLGISDQYHCISDILRAEVKMEALTYRRN